MEVRLVAVCGVRHQGELGHAEDLAVDVLDVFLPHGFWVRWIAEYAQR